MREDELLGRAASASRCGSPETLARQGLTSREEAHDAAASSAGPIRPSASMRARMSKALMLQVIDAALADAGVDAADIDRIYVGHFNAGFSKQDFPSSLALAGLAQAALQAGDPGRECLRHRQCCDPCRADQPRGATGAAGAGGGRREDDRYAGREVGANLLKASYLKEEAGDRGRLRRHLRADRPAIFPALWRPVGRAGADRRQEPSQRRRQSLCADAQGSGLRILPHRLGEEPAGGAAAEAHRLQPGLRRRGGRGAGRFRDRAGA